MRLKYNPIVTVVDQTVLCNQACYFCWRKDPRAVAHASGAAPWHTMPWDMYCQIIDAVAEVETIESLSLCGPMGDPSLVKDLCARGRYARDTGEFSGYVLINTNGFALDKHDPGELLDSFTTIHISLDAVDPVIYGRVHNRPKQLPRVLDNIRVLAKLQQERGEQKVSIRFTETKHNVSHWPDFVAALEDMGVPVMRKSEHSFIDVMPGHANSAGAILCNQPYMTVNFNFLGELTTCCVNHKMSPTFGTLADGDLKTLWESRMFWGWRRSRHQGICKNCSGLGGVSQRAIPDLTEQEQEAIDIIRETSESEYNEALRGF